MWTFNLQHGREEKEIREGTNHVKSWKAYQPDQILQ